MIIFKEKILKIKDLNVHVFKKNIKNINLNILPPNGKIRVTAPFFVSDNAIELFILKKYNWIKKHTAKFANYKKNEDLKFISGEYFFLKGEKYIFQKVTSKKPKIIIKNNNIILSFPEAYSSDKIKNYFYKWLKYILKVELNIIVPKWENIIGVKADEVRIRKMKTKWGSCNIRHKRIWINLELIEKPAVCLEYVVVHELVHLLERYHNQRFKEIMNKFMPNWREYKNLLNSNL